MGFDLSGVNPIIHKDKTEYKYYSKDSDLWKSEDEKLREKYFKDMDNYFDDNPGVYFRNNVWWWRPLWDFVCMQCSDFMSDEQKEGGSYNDGRLIDQETAAKIGTKLEILLKDGTVKRWEKHIKTRNEDLSKSKDEDTRFMSNYPFSQDNVENFAKFCLESGGFEIC
jgi:hypothetical protein